MVKSTPKMLDAPEAQNVGAVLIFSVFGFFAVPILMRLIGIGLENRPALLSWFEIAFHLLCLVVAVPLMKDYLSFSWYSVIFQKGEILFYSVVVASILLLYVALCQAIFILVNSEFFMWAGESTVPVFTTNLFVTNAYIIMLNPVFGTLCAVVIAPMTTCCIFYATAFAKGYNVRPWLGYVLVVVITLLPRLATGMTGWYNLESNLIMFASQLPAHLLCCWLYQKVDTIWAPIFAQALINLISCILSILYW